MPRLRVLRSHRTSPGPGHNTPRRRIANREASEQGKTVNIAGINPATGELLRTYTETTTSQLEQKISEAEAAFQTWRRTGFAERAEKMRALARELKARRNEFAELMGREMGKPITQGRAEVDKCGLACDYYAEHAETFLQAEAIQTDPKRGGVLWEPIGTVLAIMPWNFPFWQVFRAAVPALMAGNAMVLKHASNVFGSALAIEGAFQRAGFPAGLFQTLLISSRRVPELIADARVKAVTLTGSTEAGRSVAEQAGRTLKKTVLELGGSDPYVVLEDADLEQAVESCVSSRLINAGQSCIAAKRFIVVEKIRRQFEERFVEV